MPATSSRVYQTSTLRILAKRAIASRYSRTAVITTERRSVSLEATVSARHREARCEPLDVPLERSRKRLVEVVDAEDAPSVRCGEDPEVGEVRVPAELRLQTSSRPVREIGRHQIGGAAEERERRLEHAPVTDRAELRQARLRLLLEELDRVTAPRPRLPFGMRRARQLAARRPAAGSPLGRGEVRHRFGPRSAIPSLCARRTRGSRSRRTPS